MAQTSDWKWQNPLPSGDVLNDVKFVTPKKGWAVGNNGTILQTTDQGETWLFHETGIQSAIRAVSFSDSLHGWAVGENGLILKTTNGGAGWQVLASGSVEVLTSVCFVNSLKGCVVGSSGTILRTTNGGNTWNTSYSGTTVPFTSVWFADSTTGWAVAYNGIIRKTANGGLNWSSQTSNTTNHLYSVRFSDKQKGWAVGHDGTIIYTNDGGNSWIPMHPTGPFQPTFGAVYSLGGPDIWVTIMGGGLLKSTNGGFDWQILFYDGFPYDALFFFNDQSGIAVGYSGIGKTTNGGTSWEEVNKADRNFLRSVRFSDPNTGWAVGNDGTLLKTSNRGKNWIRQNIGTTDHLKSVFFENPQKGWILGDSRWILKTNDGGQSWQPQDTEVSFSPESIYFITSQKGWISGSDGKILTTANGGTTWQKQQTKTIQTLRSVQFVNDNVGWAVGDSGIILHTTNAGSSWIKQVSGSNVALNQAFFISDQIGSIVGNNGTFLKTSDGGNSWNSQILAQGKYLYSIQFTDSLHGWISGEEGTLLHSTDGGNSWESTPDRATSNGLYGIYFEPSGIGWAVGANGTIISNSGLDDGIARSLIKGKLFEKSGSDCNTTNLPVSGHIVKATPGPFYGYARKDGNYELRLPLGIAPNTYDITTAPTGNYAYQTSLVCPTGGVYNISLDTLPDTLSNKDFGFDVSHCHLLKVEIASNHRRRCFGNNTTVFYFNHGSVPAADAYVLVEFPSWVRPVSASKDHTTINDYTWRFDLGNILPGTGGTINIIDSVLCSAPLDLDLILCTRATIFPVPDCPMPAGWNGAEVTVTGKCHNGNVGLGIYNKTTHDMADSVDFTVYLDSIQVKSGKVKLMAGDSLKLNAQPFGKTVTLIVSQVPSHPSEVFVSNTIEGCSDTIGSIPHLLVNHFPKVQTASSKTQCLSVLTSIDPNDKQVLPIGFTANHVVQPGTQLEYMVRFQNTGNDTAFTAFVVDSLDQNLNVESLEIGAVSHPYEITLQTTRQGRNVLRFQFDHIYLPDSTTNELQSHGFIQFRISPKADIPLGTQVKNEAAIYFDYNPPVFTNQTLTTFDNLVLTDTSLNSHVQIVTSSQPVQKKRDLVSVYPNPFSKGITLQSGSAESLSVSLCDLMGKEVQSLQFTGSVELSLSHLPAGVYLLKIPSRNQTLKLVKQE